MKTLEEIAMGGLVTIGCWQTSDIPCTLRAEFTDLVKSRITGCGYMFDCEFDGDWKYLEYDIDWKRGTWIFTARTFSENSWTESKAEIHSIQEKVLSNPSMLNFVQCSLEIVCQSFCILSTFLVNYHFQYGRSEREPI